ncbi:MAG: hypothetical protein BMS9Abin15_0600 [Gammaproteobacteria bacterium]|nr:MAG: hypothetical protein BMS9Abin15_0600 [Gammaproteobacteria bacterium]
MNNSIYELSAHGKQTQIPVFLKKHILALVTFSLLASLAWAANPVLKDFDGKPAAIEDFTEQGKWLIVMIWASDCHVCNEEVGNYEAFHTAHKGDNAAVLGISLDGSDKKREAVKFIKRHQITFPNLIGEPDEVADMFYQLTGSPWIGTPTFLIYNQAGKLVIKQEGGVPTSLIENYIELNSVVSN